MSADRPMVTGAGSDAHCVFTEDGHCGRWTCGRRLGESGDFADGATTHGGSEYGGEMNAWQSQGTLLEVGAKWQAFEAVASMFMFAYPRCNFSSTLYPQRCYVTQVVRSLYTCIIYI
jgi:hypothetical protein